MFRLRGSLRGCTGEEEADKEESWAAGNHRRCMF
jgi:hypothetical protein